MFSALMLAAGMRPEIVRHALRCAVVSSALMLASVPLWAQAAVGGAAEAQRPNLPPGTRVALVTGSTDGLGREVALALADSGYHVLVHGRNEERGNEVVSAIRSKEKSGARFYRADFASIGQVAQLASEIQRDYPRIDLLVNNAGVWMQGSERMLSADGHEMHFAVNYLAAYQLTRALLPLMQANASARIVNVASSAQSPIDFDDVMLVNGYSNGRGYGQSKTALVMLTLDLAAELTPRGIKVVALHPATFMATSMILSRGSQPRSTVEQGRDAVLNAALNAAVETGTFLNGERVARAASQAYDAEARSRLRQLTERLLAGR